MILEDMIVTVRPYQYRYTSRTVQKYGTEHVQLYISTCTYDDLSKYRICKNKYCSYWYEYKYRTAVSSVVSMCTVTVRAGHQVRIDARSSDAILHSEAYYSSTELQY